MLYLSMSEFNQTTDFSGDAQVLKKPLVCRPELTPQRLTGGQTQRIRSSGKQIESLGPLDRERNTNYCLIHYLGQSDSTQHKCFSHQSSCFVVDQFELFVQCNLLYAEGHAGKAQLPCNVHATHFHIHCNNLHGANTPGT